MKNKSTIRDWAIILALIIILSIVGLTTSCSKGGDNLHEPDGPTLVLQDIPDEFSVGDTMIVDATQSSFSKGYPFSILEVKRMNSPIIVLEYNTLKAEIILDEPGDWTYNINVWENRDIRGWGGTRAIKKVSVK